MTQLLTAAPERDTAAAVRAAPRRVLWRAFTSALVVVLLAIELAPLVWLILSSFKSDSEFVNEPAWTLPRHWNFGNYAEAWTGNHVGTYIRNSLAATLPSLVLIIVLGVAAGFALEVMVWRGRHQVLLVFLLGIMVPSQMILLPLFKVYFQLGLSRSLWPLILSYTATGLPLTVFMMATYFRAIPRDLFEAATIDGASILRAFWTIGFPLARNGIFTVALVQFFFTWNDLLIALTFTTNDELRTLQVGLLNFTGEYGQTTYGPLFAAISLSVVGTLLLYLIINQRVMEGLTQGSVKG